MSLLETKETIDSETLEQIAKTLKVSVEAIKNDEGVINIVANTVNNHDNANGNSLFMYYPTFNPIDKYVEAVEKNEKLYEALLKAEREKIALMEKMLSEKIRSKENAVNISEPPSRWLF